MLLHDLLLLSSGGNHAPDRCSQHRLGAPFSLASDLMVAVFSLRVQLRHGCQWPRRRTPLKLRFPTEPRENTQRAAPGKAHRFPGVVDVHLDSRGFSTRCARKTTPPFHPRLIVRINRTFGPGYSQKPEPGSPTPDGIWPKRDRLRPAEYLEHVVEVFPGEEEMRVPGACRSAVDVRHDGAYAEPGLRSSPLVHGDTDVPIRSEEGDQVFGGSGSQFEPHPVGVEGAPPRVSRRHPRPRALQGFAEVLATGPGVHAEGPQAEDERDEFTVDRNTHSTGCLEQLGLVGLQGDAHGGSQRCRGPV